MNKCSTYLRMYYPRLEVPQGTLHATIHSNDSFSYSMYQIRIVIWRTYPEYVTENKINWKTPKVSLKTSKSFCRDTEGFSGGECHEVTGYSPYFWQEIKGLPSGNIKHATWCMCDDVTVHHDIIIPNKRHCAIIPLYINRLNSVGHTPLSTLR